MIGDIGASAAADGPQQPFISVRGVWKSFTALDVLRGLSLDVAAGEIVALIGPSGSGKSTLLRCIAGLERVDDGQIEIRGLPLAGGDATVRAVVEPIGMVFQGFNVFPHMSVLENVANPLKVIKGFGKDQAAERAHQALAKVSLTDKSTAYPVSLSGGQRQRLAIARAMAMEPQIILFDEPTSALDPELAHGVLETIKSLADEGLGMLIVTHQVHFISRFADRIAFVDEGVVRLEGPPDFVMSHPDERLHRFLARLEETK